jgi:hypothetical protein
MNAKQAYAMAKAMVNMNKTGKAGGVKGFRGLFDLLLVLLLSGILLVALAPTIFSGLGNLTGGSIPSYLQLILIPVFAFSIIYLIIEYAF